MSVIKKLRAVYLRWTKYDHGTSSTDIDMSIKVDEFIEELTAAKRLGLLDGGGWLNLRIIENAKPEGNGNYSHKLKIIS